ncbi:MAG: polyprenyl synthetase family protein, partial [Terrimesophilobacter sp.]
MTPTTLRIDWIECQDLVSERLESFFSEKEWLAKPYGRHYAALWASARDSASGGKKFRPALVGNAYRHLGGRDDELAVAVATAFELLHTAFLMHDDVIDDDLFRRGAPNVVGRFTSDAEDRGVSGADARGWGEASAILAGDLLIHAAGSLIARMDVDANTRISLLDLVDESLFVTVAGELADVAFSTSVQAPVLSEVLDMTQWKTAHYSFQAPLQAAAILAGADREVHQMLGAFGAQIGVAFQLRDDILGMFGNEDATGKSWLSDIDAGKITPLMFYAKQMSPT